MPEVIVCGPASWNRIVNLDELPRPEPHMQFARSDYETLGGTSAGKALHLHDLGRPVLLHTVVGTDATAGRILAALRDAGVPVSAEVVPGPSERHLNLMGPDGQRVSIYLATPADGGTGRAEGLREALRSARAAVLDLSVRSRELLDEVRDIGVPVWTDIHDYDGSAPFHRPFIEAASHVFMNDDGLTDPLDFMHATIDGGARTVVCTLGPRGAVAVDAAHTVHRVPAAPVPRVSDTNGAGDAFMAGFLHVSLDGAPVDAALGAGARQARRALTTRHLSPLLDREALE